jgi:hypothetical protein
LGVKVVALKMGEKGSFLSVRTVTILTTRVWFVIEFVIYCVLYFAYFCSLFRHSLVGCVWNFADLPCRGDWCDWLWWRLRGWIPHRFVFFFFLILGFCDYHLQAWWKDWTISFALSLAMRLALVACVLWERRRESCRMTRRWSLSSDTRVEVSRELKCDLCNVLMTVLISCIIAWSLFILCTLEITIWFVIDYELFLWIYKMEERTIPKQQWIEQRL